MRGVPEAALGVSPYWTSSIEVIPPSGGSLATVESAFGCTDNIDIFYAYFSWPCKLFNLVVFIFCQ